MNAAWPARPRPRWPLIGRPGVDRRVAALLLVIGQLEVWLTPHQRPAVTALVSVAACATVATRRSYPLVSAAVAQTLTAGEIAYLGDTQILASAVAYFCALYALAVWTSGRRFLAGLGVLVATDLGTGPQSGWRASVAFCVVTLVALVLVRRVVGDRDRRLALVLRERDVIAREAVLAERERIARELHDVVAHHASMIVLQAGAERKVRGPSGGPSGEVLKTIEELARSVLAEMRQLVHALRGDEPGDESGDLAPLPRLAQLPTLMRQIEETGLAVTFRQQGATSRLPDSVDLAGYRIIQEALTNVVRHARASRATVDLNYRLDALVVRVADDGPGRACEPAGRGHGLVGMRERAAQCGGSLVAEAVGEGGFVVCAELPLP